MGFWNITAHDLLIIGALLVYWWLSRAYCLIEIDSCYARLANCTMEKFPNASLINWNASGINISTLFNETFINSTTGR